MADFNKYRQAGRSHPLMDKIERLFERKDWFQPPDNASAKASVGVIETAPHQADDIPSGDRLIEEGKFDEALDVYRRRIEISQAKLTNGRVNLQALEDRQIAIERMSDLAFVSVLKRDFQKAHDLADGAVRILPNATWPNLRRAHALMFLDRCDEARELYRRFAAGKATTELTWQDIIRSDFSAIRNAGLSHSLMTEIEQNSLTS